jgi:PAS domain S-box-containing protein
VDLTRYRLIKVREDPELILYRGYPETDATTVLILAPNPRHVTATYQERLEREHSLSETLEADWAIRPLALVRHERRPALLFEDPGGVPLNSLLGQPMEILRCLSIGIGISAALRHTHEQGLIHHDIKPGNVFVDDRGQVRLTGFGFATRLPRERQARISPGLLPGTLTYMAPERTGHVNRSVDARSDLYSLGVTLYEMLTGAPPFVTVDPMELIHCHIARRPSAPRGKVADIPIVIESIVMKLLAKDAEDRYQTAAGVEYDLQRCLGILQSTSGIPSFHLGEHDTADQLFVPERLYGRDNELAVLQMTLREVAGGGFWFLLVSGPSGIGKSSLVRELRRASDTRRVLFAEGRCDQFRRDIPYKCIADGIRDLLQQILMLDDLELERWRMSLSQAVGSLGRLMLELIPELVHIIGEQPKLPSPSHEEERQRLFPVFRRLLAECARFEHPLVLFLDDLQWSDSATVELLEQMTVNREIPYLLMIGSYRTEDILAADLPVQRVSVTNGRFRGARELALGPLTVNDIESLVADSLRTDTATIGSLAQFVHEKAQGNVFLIRQFLIDLYVEGLLRFDPRIGVWQWDLAAIRKKTIRDSGTSVITTKLQRHGEQAREALKQLACLGHRGQAATMAKLLGTTEESVHRVLLDLVADDLLHRFGGEYSFSHDRVREAAYSLLTDQERPYIHLRTARVLVDGISHEALEDAVFEILNHYRNGIALIEAPAEAAYVAKLSLMAGKRARAAAAFESAVLYLSVGRALLEPCDWQSSYEIAFGLELNLADCEFILGDVESAEARLAALSLKCRSDLDRALVVGRQMILYVHQSEFERAVQGAIQCLQTLGEILPRSPSDRDIEDAYRNLLTGIGSRSIDTLANLPLMTDGRLQTVTELLEALAGPAGATNLNLITLSQLRIASIAVEHGISDAAAHAFAGLTRVVGWNFGELETGQRFGRLALRLVDDRGLHRFAERVYGVIAAFAAPYTQPLRECGQLALRAAELGPERGGVSFSGYSWALVSSFLFDGGAPLSEVQRRAEEALASIKKGTFTYAVILITIPLMVVRALRGLTPSLAESIANDVDEYCVRVLTQEHKFIHNANQFWTRQLQLRYYAGNIPGCLEAIGAVEDAKSHIPLYEIVCQFCFFSALTHAAILSDPAAKNRDEYWRALLECRDKLTMWAARCAANFADRACLVSAEVARLQGHVGAASGLYEESIRLAREQAFVQNEALANELAARFYESRGLKAIRDAYARNARSCYLRWGADGKVRELDQHYPHITDEVTPRISSVEDARAQLQNVDFGAVINMHQAVSEEIVFNRLIERLMATVVEHAGAVRGLLLLPQDGEMQVVAEAVTGRNSVTVHLRHQAGTAGELPQSVLNYVVRTQDYVIVDDAMTSRVHSADEYVRRVRPKAILCLPLVKQKRLVGILYLENTLSSHVFTAERLSVLQLLASQAAISIENANLFRDAQRAQESAKRVGEELRRSFDMIPALAWRASPDGRFEFANRQWHEYTGISPEEALSGSWIRSFHTDDEEKVEAAWYEALEGGSAGEVEARMQRYDGEIRSFLVRVTPMHDGLGKVIAWHGTHTDIENLKRAEQAQEALARVSRITAMGELTVSITHEVSQPLMAIEMNAASCLHWLDEEQLDVSRARQAVKRIVRDGQRARDVIASMRMLTRKASPETTEVDINEVIHEVMTLTRNELRQHRISAELELTADVGATRGVRVQIQQVILNLVINAIEAMADCAEDFRHLRIRSIRDAPTVATVSVADWGVGLDSMNCEKVFEAFYTTKSEGLGLGLSICRSIIESHGGRLWAAPNVPRGSVFTFSLPLTNAR